MNCHWGYCEKDCRGGKEMSFLNNSIVELHMSLDLILQLYAQREINDFVNEGEGRKVMPLTS